MHGPRPVASISTVKISDKLFSVKLSFFFFSNKHKNKKYENLESPAVESLWFELVISYARPNLIASAYGALNDESFFDNFRERLKKIDNCVELLVLGSFNCDVIKNSSLAKK